MRFGTAVPIAAGATGRVVRTFDAERGEEIALKLLHRDDPDWVQRMLREAEVQMRLDHPHICRVYGTGRMGGQPWIAMQLVEGSTLDEAARGLSDRDKAALLAQVADAIAYAHGQGVVHRDLKPSNILVERRNGVQHAVVVDFGLVRVVDAPELTRTGQLLGTPGYMAPEQATAAATVDGRADIFSLGVIAFELFAGRRPFSGESAAEVLLHTLRHEPPSLQSLRPDIDPALARIVRQCLETDRDWRYGDASRLREDLLAFRDGRRVLARRDGGWRRARRFARRHPWRAGLGTAAALLLAGLLGVTAYAAWYGSQQSAAAQRYTEFAAQVEHALRLEYMKPAHDLGPVVERIGGQVRAFAAALPGSGPAARRSGRLALGRALAALDQHAAAEQALVAALAAGEDGLVLHATLGQVLLRRYFEAVQDAASIGNPELRADALARLDARYRTSARRHLGEAAGGDDAQAAQMRALLAWLDGRAGEAEDGLSAVAGQLAWPVDALLLAGELAAADGVRMGLAGNAGAALQRWRDAAGRYARAEEIARSHPGIAVKQCLAGGAMATLALQGAAVASAEYEAALAHCARAIALDGASARTHAAHAQAMADLGLLQRARGTWDDLAIEPAIASARRAIALDPHSASGHRALGALLAQRVYWRLERGRRDVLPVAEEAIAALARAREADPSSADGVSTLAMAYRGAARAAIAAGQPGEPYLVAGEQALEEAIAGGEAPVALQVELIDNQSWRGYEAYMRGEDAEALLLQALERGRALYRRAPQHPGVGPVYAMAAWTLADYRWTAGLPAEDLAREAVVAYRRALDTSEPSVATLFNAASALQVLATVRSESGLPIAAEVRELRTWLARLRTLAGDEEPIDIQLGEAERLAALEAIRTGDDPEPAFAAARGHLAKAFHHPLDARQAWLSFVLLATDQHAWRRAHDRFDAAAAAADVAAVEAALAEHAEMALLKCEAARLLAALPAAADRRDRARRLLQAGLAQMPLLERRYAGLAAALAAPAEPAQVQELAAP